MDKLGDKKQYLENLKILIDDILSDIENREFFLIDINTKTDEWNSVLCMTNPVENIENIATKTINKYTKEIEQENVIFEDEEYKKDVN